MNELGFSHLRNWSQRSFQLCSRLLTSLAELGRFVHCIKRLADIKELSCETSEEKYRDLSGSFGFDVV